MTVADDRPDEAGTRRLLDAARLAPPGVGEWIGPYELLEEIGRGGHSAVFRARQHQPVRRELAVKLLADPAPSANVAARFARERSLVARLRHPGIVPLIDAGEVGFGHVLQEEPHAIALRGRGGAEHGLEIGPIGAGLGEGGFDGIRPPTIGGGEGEERRRCQGGDGAEGPAEPTEEAVITNHAQGWGGSGRAAMGMWSGVGRAVPEVEVFSFRFEAGNLES